MKKYMILWVLTSLVWIVLSSSAFARVAKQEGTSCFITQPNTLSVDGVMISEYTCSQTTVKIPSQINWETVVQIGENAFRNKGITSLTLPNTLKAIEALAFADNALTRLEIQEWVETIGLGAFKRNQISVLKMPQSLKEIDADAFKANKLTKITVLWRLNKVWDGAFCDNITEKVEGVSESLEWEFTNACFSLKRASLLENSYPNDEIEIEETGEEIIMINSNEITDEEVDDELNEEVILEELDKDIEIVGLELTPFSAVWKVSYEGAENFHKPGADQTAYGPWSILEDKVCIEAKIIFSDGSEFSTGGALTTPYENDTVNQWCGWGSAINIDDVQRIVLGDLVLWEAK